MKFAIACKSFRYSFFLSFTKRWRWLKKNRFSILRDRWWRKANYFKLKKFSLKYKYFFNYFFLIVFRRRHRRRVYKGFFYRLNVVPTYKRRKRVNYRYVKIRIVKCFFVFLSYKQFRRLAKLAKLKSGLFEHTYLLFLEGRLVNFLYRTGFMETLFQSFYYIKGGFIFINLESSTFIINV